MPTERGSIPRLSLDTLDSPSTSLLAHCCMCHATYPEEDVIFQASGVDECPKCHHQNVTFCMDGHHDSYCPCGDVANDLSGGYQ